MFGRLARLCLCSILQMSLSGLVAVSTHVGDSSCISNDVLAAMRRRQRWFFINSHSLKSVGDTEGRGRLKKSINIKTMSAGHVIFKIHRGRRERKRVMI